MAEYKTRKDLLFPYQSYNPCPDTLVKVYNLDGEGKIACSNALFWGYEDGICGEPTEGTIVRWLELSKPTRNETSGA